MPDLSLAESHAFWMNYDDPTVYRVICFMESIEEWTLDGDVDLEQSLKELGELLDSLESVDLSSKEKLIEIGAYIKTSRTLRLLQALDTIYPGAASKCLLKSEELGSSNLAADLFLRRNIAFERLRLLHRIMSPERLDFLQQALESDHEN